MRVLIPVGGRGVYTSEVWEYQLGFASLQLIQWRWRWWW